MAQATKITPIAGGGKIAIAVGSTATGTTAGGIASVVNPTGQDVWIDNCILAPSVVSDAAGTVDIGVAATVASNDTLLDGADMNALTAVHKVTGTGNASPEATLWPAGYYLTVTKATGAANAEKNFTASLTLQWHAAS